MDRRRQAATNDYKGYDLRASTDLPERAGRAMSARGMKVFMMGAVVCRGELEGLRDLRLICRHVELSRLAAALFLFGGGVWWGSVGWCGCRVG